MGSIKLDAPPPYLRQGTSEFPWETWRRMFQNYMLASNGASGADPEGGFGGFEPPPWSSKSFTSTVKLPSPNVSHSGGAL